MSLNLPRLDLFQHPINSLHLFPDDANGLLVGRVGSGNQCIHGVADLMVPIGDKADSSGCVHLVLVNAARDPYADVGESQPKAHLDGQPVFSAVEIEKEQPIDRFSST